MQATNAPAAARICIIEEEPHNNQRQQQKPIMQQLANHQTNKQTNKQKRRHAKLDNVIFIFKLDFFGYFFS
jgi:hypothetical protein